MRSPSGLFCRDSPSTNCHRLGPCQVLRSNASSNSLQMTASRFNRSPPAPQADRIAGPKAGRVKCKKTARQVSATRLQLIRTKLVLFCMLHYPLARRFAWRHVVYTLFLALVRTSLLFRSVSARRSHTCSHIDHNLEAPGKPRGRIPFPSRRFATRAPEKGFQLLLDRV